MYIFVTLINTCTGICVQTLYTFIKVHGLSLQRKEMRFKESHFSLLHILHLQQRLCHSPAHTWSRYLTEHLWTRKSTNTDTHLGHHCVVFNLVLGHFQ